MSEQCGDSWFQLPLICLEQQKTPQPVVAKLIATPDAVSRLSPALADAILPFLNKFPDAHTADPSLQPPLAK
jgi:hypothetical protein